MKANFARAISVLLLALFFAQSSFATCGGGGGGGGGGMSSGGGGTSNTPVYVVPWKIRKPTDAPAAGLVLYWFPASEAEVRNSSLRQSRILSLYASQCVAMEISDGRAPKENELIGTAQLPLAVLAKSDGTAIGKVNNTGGKLKVADVEKLLDTEMKDRESALTAQMKEAAGKATAGDKDGAVAMYKSVLDQKCLFPKKAKEAQKQLKSLGVTDVGSVIPPTPVFDRAQSAAIERVMRRGLIAENRAQYVLANKLYGQAHRMDPADPTPLRYLGENYRHNIGDWAKAREVFQQILDMPADPLSRSVALHGLGKMTIHDGEFKKGLALMEQAIAEYPLALAYRNLAVYWNSEGDPAKGNEYTEKALALDPKDPYNLVFAAVFMAANGRKAEALKIARENINLMPASYNLAAIFAQNGHKDRALALLRRHFFTYERYQAVREKEMMEARVDAVFDSIRFDQEFIALTRGADGKLPVPMKGMPATQAMPRQ